MSSLDAGSQRLAVFDDAGAEGHSSDGRRTRAPSTKPEPLWGAGKNGSEDARRPAG